MKNLLLTLSSLALASSMAFAGADKELAKKIEDQGIYVETAKPGVVLSGYVDAGYTYNFNGPSPRTADNVRVGADNTAKGDFNLNTFKLALEKPLGDANDFAAGFRVDLMYGEDSSQFTDRNATGNNGNSSDFAVEQAFVQFRAPVGNGLDFRVGKFVTMLGLEVVERPANPNITYGLIYQNMIPLDHIGVMALYKFNDIVDVKGAVVNGWNGADSNGTIMGANNVAEDAYGVTGAINIKSPGGNANIQNGFYIGAGGDSNVLANVNNPDVIYLYDIWGTWKPTFANNKLLLGFVGNYGGAPNNTANISKAGYENWWGFGLYSKYQFTEIFSLAGRLEYISNTDGSKWAHQNNAAGGVDPVFGTNGNDIYSYTITAGFDVWENMLLRAEYRADWGNDWVGPFNGSSANGRFGVSHLAALQAVYSF